MKAPTPPKELQKLQEEQGAQEALEDAVEVERSETVEVVLFEYEDEEVSFNISFEFVYTFSQSLDADVLVE